MSNVKVLLQTLSGLGVRIKLEAENELRIRGNSEQLTHELVQQIRAEKTAIIDWLLSHQEANLQIIPVQPRDREFYPLSFSQQRFWLMDQLEGGTPQYNLPAALRISGMLDVERLGDAFNQVVANHEILRTTYHPDQDGNGVQCVHPHQKMMLEEIDLSTLSLPERETRLTELTAAQAARTFLLSEEAPLKLLLVKLSDEDRVLLLNVHHIAADGWSLARLVESLTAAYQGINQPPLPIQYVDYSIWQREQLSDHAFEEQLNYWKNQLKDLPQVHGLPLDKRRPTQQSFAGNTIVTTLPQTLSKQLKQFCATHDSTLYMVLQTAFAVLLSRISNEQDIVIGCPSSGRVNKDLDRLIGCFVNTLVLRTQFETCQSFSQLLARSKALILDAQNNANVPFELLVEHLCTTRSLSHNPLFQIVFSLDNSDSGGLTLPGLQFTPVEQPFKLTKFDLELTMTELTDSLKTAWTYSNDLFDDETIERLATSFELLLSQVVTDPDADILSYELVNDADKKMLFQQWNDTQVDLPYKQCIHELFIATASRSPESIAIIDEQGQISYGELLQQVDALTRLLLVRSVNVEELVAVRMSRGRSQVIATLAIMMAGGAYLPIERDWPEGRCLNILTKANSRLLIVDDTCDVVGHPDLTTIHFSDALATAELRDIDAIVADYRRRTEVGQLAYVIFTSGSTGTPKGVAISHQSAVNTLLDINQRYGVTDDDRILAVSALSFDLSVYDYFGLLAAGGVVVIPFDSKAKDPRHWLDMVEQNKITIWDTVPVSAGLLVEQLNQDGRASTAPLRLIMMSGDWIAPALPPKLKKCFPGVEVYSLGGATEGSIWSINYPITEDTTKWKSIPYGKPLGNQKFFILNRELKACPVGVTGELHIGGVGVASAYYGEPELTATRFITHPELGERLYKTGDLGRYRGDGNIEFMGRVDHQQKIRGFRVELGEIESELNKLDYIETAVARVSGDGEGKVIVAYVVPVEPLSDETKAHESHRLPTRLGKILPEYMLPSAVVFLDALPLSANGKVDNKRLPPVDFSKHRTHQFVAPRNELENSLAELWCELLNVENVGIHDNFFRLGGHSLIGIILITRIRESMGLELQMREVFDSPTIAALAEKLGHLQSGTQFPPCVAKEHNGPLPLSYAQQRLWTLSEVEQTNSQYNIIQSFRIQGQFSREAFQYALDEIVSRHEILRTNYYQGNDGVAFQHCNAPRSVSITEHDLRALNGTDQQAAVEEITCADAQRSFDFTSDLMLRAHLITLGKQDFIITVNLHHIAADGWSIRVLVQEFKHFYHAHIAAKKTPLPGLKLQYRDYSVWQRDVLHGEACDRLLDYWLRQLADLPLVHGLPTDHTRSAVQGFEGQQFEQQLDAKLTERLSTLCGQHEVTLFALLETAFALLVSRYSGERDIVIGTPVAGREHQGLDELIGFFVNTVVLRTTIDTAMSFDELLAENKEMIVDGLSHQAMPFEMLVEAINPERSLSHNPLFQIMFSIQNMEIESLDIVDTNVTALGSSVFQSKFDLELTAVQHVDGVTLHWGFNTGLFEPSTIKGMAGAFATLLEAIVADPNQNVSALPLAAPTQLDQLALWNDTEKTFEDAICIHRLFERRVDEDPDATAVTFEGHSLSYSELNEQANRLACHLREQGLGRDDIVGICLDRSIALVISMLAVMKAGASYTPLEPELPVDRFRYQCEIAQVNYVLSSSRLDLTWLDTLDVKVVDVERQDLFAHHSIDNLIWGNEDPSRLAYVIFTSGSTGRPKGVMMAHQGLVNRIQWMAVQYDIDSTDVVLQKTPISFDVSVWEFFLPLCQGARLVLARPEGHREPDYLMQLIREEKVSCVHFVPSMLSAYLQVSSFDGCEALRHVFCSGEVLSTQLQAQYFAVDAQAQLHNLYGPTEAAIDVSYHNCKLHPLRSTIGRPIDNIRLYVLNESGQCQPPGVAGELYIGGAGLARGYINSPELTARQFVTMKVNGFRERLYKTGDLASWSSNGQLNYLGRRDFQVKLNGHRIELGEIETQLVALDSVDEAVVVANGELGSQRLVAYVVRNDEQEDDLWVQTAIRQLTGQLPDYMVPRLFVSLAEMPINNNGKLDRKALPEPNLDCAGPRQLPQSELEANLCLLWADALGIESVGILDNFFALGGDSIIAIQVAARAKQKGLNFSVRTLFEYPTVAALAGQVEQGEVRHFPQQPVTGSMALIPIQQAYLEGADHKVHYFNQSVLLNIDCTLTSEAQTKLVAAILARHDALRLRFLCFGGKWEGLFQPLDETLISSAIERFDLSHLNGAERRKMQLQICERAQQELNINTGPIFRSIWLDHGSDGGRLLLIAHHLVVDGVSWRILLKDLDQAWRQLWDGNAIQLEAKTASYKQWREALERYAETLTLQEQRNYWVEQLSLPRKSLEKGLAAASTFSIEIDEVSTELLLRECNKNYRTHTQELLLAALLHAWQRWRGDSVLLLAMEGHGREEIDPGIDLSETVGWFTSHYPLVLSCSDQADLGDTIRAVKEQYRALPDNGLGFGVLRYLSDDQVLTELETDWIANSVEFNYLGQFDQVIDGDTPFRIADEPKGRERSAEKQGQSPITVTGMVVNQCLRFELRSVSGFLSAEQCAELGEHFKEALGGCVNLYLDMSFPQSYRSEPNCTAQSIEEFSL